jgi:hypothetical protein
MITQRLPHILIGYLTIKDGTTQKIYKKYTQKEIPLPPPNQWTYISAQATHYNLSNPDFDTYNNSLTPPTHFIVSYSFTHKGTVFHQTLPYPQNIDIQNYLTT